MSEVDEVIARLVAEGELDGTGGFTLDPAVALAKLREHQLRDPSRFVLSWVRAAILLGAARVDVEIDADDVVVGFEASPLTDAELDRLWVLAADQRGSLRAAGGHELALGIHGAFAWSAKAVTIDSGGARLEFDPELRVTRSALAQPTRRTIVRAERPLGWDLIRRKRLDLRGELPEELALAHACAHADVEITLDGRRLGTSGSDQLEPKPWIRVELDRPPAQVVGALVLREGVRSVVRLLKAGVLVCELELPYPEVEAIIDDPWLPLDLGQDKPVDGERLAAIHATLERTRWRAWFELATREGWSGPIDGAPHLYRRLVGLLLSAPDLDQPALVGAEAFATQVVLARAVDDASGGFRSLTDEPVPASRRASAPPLTLADVIEAARRDGFVYTASHRLRLPYLPDLPVLERAEPLAPWQRSLDRPEHVLDYWRAARARRRLDGASLLVDAEHGLELSGEGHRVWVTWLGAERIDRGLLVLGRDGARLAELLLPPSCGPIRVDVDGPFTAEGELPLDAQVATATLAALSRMHELVAAVARAEPGPADRGWIDGYLPELANQRWSAQRLAEMTAIPAGERTLALTRWPGPWGVPGGLAEALAHPLATIGWLTQADARRSTRELEAASRSGPLLWIDRGAPEAPELPAEVLRLSATERRQVELLLPGALAPFDREGWARRDPGPATVPDALAEGPHVLVTGPAGLTGRLARVEGAWACGVTLRVLVRGHELAPVELALPFGRFVGVIELPGATALPHSQRVGKDATWQAAIAAVEASAKTLVAAKLAAWVTDAPLDRGDGPLVAAWAAAFERGAWPELGAQFFAWQSRLTAAHPLRVEPPRS